MALNRPHAGTSPSSTRGHVGARTGAAYMTLVNKGAAADRLIGAATPDAETVQFHNTTNDNGVMRMREVSSPDLKPGSSVVFDPGHLHVMLLGLKQSLKEGQTLPLTLKFEKAGDIAVAIPIQRVGAMSGDMSPMH
jgi:copper(I)-binding protein